MRTAESFEGAYIDAVYTDAMNQTIDREGDRERAVVHCWSTSQRQD